MVLAPEPAAAGACTTFGATTCNFECEANGKLRVTVTGADAAVATCPNGTFVFCSTFLFVCTQAKPKSHTAAGTGSCSGTHTLTVATCSSVGPDPGVPNYPQNPTVPIDGLASIAGFGSFVALGGWLALRRRIAAG
ncbi:MAG TPA: hypothetical protein VHF47_14180 [Acidimicrobiales bacterium]|nr:hypothetical protein [Acidimicrobiales bacterium]